MKGIHSSGSIEEACKTDIRFMWILGEEAAPDHSTIARFQNERLIPVIEALFYQLIDKLIEMNEISYTNVFIDGTKIEANANKYTFVWAKAVEKNLAKLESKIEALTKHIKEKYFLKDDASFEDCLHYLMYLASLKKIEFVYGKGRRKTQIQRDIDCMVELGDKRHGYLENLKIAGKRKSFSKIDKDATFMRMKEDYMNNGQLKPGYNVRIAVESEYIVGLGLFHNPTDTTTLIPFMERIQRQSGRKIENIIADAGYASEENFSCLESHEQNAYTTAIIPQVVFLLLSYSVYTIFSFFSQKTYCLFLEIVILYSYDDETCPVFVDIYNIFTKSAYQTHLQETLLSII